MTLQTQTQTQFELKIKNKTEFNQILLQAIDEAFSTLSNDNNQAIYNHLESIFKIKTQELPNKLTEFTDAIEQTFGLAAGLIEIRIMAKLHAKVQSNAYYLKSNELFFAEYLVNLQAFFTST